MVEIPAGAEVQISSDATVPVAPAFAKRVPGAAKTTAETTSFSPLAPLRPSPSAVTASVISDVDAVHGDEVVALRTPNDAGAGWQGDRQYIVEGVVRGEGNAVEALTVRLVRDPSIPNGYEQAPDAKKDGAFTVPVADVPKVFTGSDVYGHGFEVPDERRRLTRRRSGAGVAAPGERPPMA